MLVTSESGPNISIPENTFTLLIEIQRLSSDYTSAGSQCIWLVLIQTIHNLLAIETNVLLVFCL